jgi:hypothetical protein
MIELREIEIFGVSGPPPPSNGVTRLEAEDYASYFNPVAGGVPVVSGDDAGFEGCTDTLNPGGRGTGCGQNMGWTDNGDYVEWQYDARVTGRYQIDLRVATNGTASSEIHVDGTVVHVFAPGSIPNTNGWQNWTTVTTPAFYMGKGSHAVRVLMTSGVQNLNYIEVREPCAGVVCPEPANQCLRSHCHERSGRCLDVQADGYACDDGDPSTNGEICVHGKCLVPAMQPNESCATATSYVETLLSIGPGTEVPRAENIEGMFWYNEYNDALGLMGAGGDRIGVISLTVADPITIPVVVHVLEHPLKPTGVTAEHVRAGIDGLNLRYGAVDLATLRPVFRPVAGTSHLRFELAQRRWSPDGGCSAFTPPQNYPDDIAGMNRVDVDSTRNEDGIFTVGCANPGWTNPDEGGFPPWPQDQYLNVYVADLGDSNGACACPQYEWGLRMSLAVHYAYLRHGIGDHTLAHEVAHYFGLDHVDDDIQREIDLETRCLGTTDGAEGTCSTEGDRICDTPAMLEFPHGEHCPAWLDSCQDSLPLAFGTANPDPPDQVENYMVHWAQGCETMFTFYQVQTMESVLSVLAPDYARRDRALLTGSSAMSPPVDHADLWIRDGEGDNGEPNHGGAVVHWSSDIWVRREPDDIVVHENPVYRDSNGDEIGDPMSVYVRVRNRACPGTENATATGTLRLYWAKAGTNLQWRYPWNAATIEVPGAGGAGSREVLIGGPIGEPTELTEPVPPGESRVERFDWNPPNPADYEAVEGDKSHFCFLAIIGDEPDTRVSLPDLVRESNDIAWKNVTVLGETDDLSGYVAIGAPSTYEPKHRLVFEPMRDLPSVFDLGAVSVDLGQEIFDRWDLLGIGYPWDLFGDDISYPGSGTVVTLEQPGAVIRGIPLEPPDFITIRITVEPEYAEAEPQMSHMEVYYLNVTQYAEQGEIGSNDPQDLREVGAQGIQLKTTIPVTLLTPPDPD